MSSFSILEQIVSVEDVVRNYRAIFDKVKKSKKPIIILRRNTPDVALVDVGWLINVEEKLHDIEEERALRIVHEGKKEFKKGKAKTLKSITSLV